MKRYRADDYWFELTTGTLPGGGFGRLYRLTCRECRTAVDQSGRTRVSNDQLRKIFQRQGWEVGRNRFQHWCPRCQLAAKGEPSWKADAIGALNTYVKEPPPPTLDEVWAAANDETRLDFIIRKIDELNLTPSAPKPLPLLSSGPPPEPLPEAELAEDEPAEWWQALMQK